MKILKINWLNVFGILLFFALILFFINKYQFDSIEQNQAIKRQGENNIVTISTNPTKLLFIPNRDNVSGLVVSIDKRTYLPGEENLDIIVNIKYADRFNSTIIYNYEYKYPMNSMALGGVEVFKFPELKNSKGQEITVNIKSSGEVPVKDGIKIQVSEYRILYHESVKNILSTSTFYLNYDKKFQFFYFSLLGIVLLSILFLLIFRSKKLEKNLNNYGKKKK